jgi:ribosome-associated protein
MLYIVPGLTLDERELEFRFVRARGPGGQNVNKVSSAVELRFDTHSPAAAGFPPDMLPRLATLAGQRMTNEGVIVIQADSHRTQTANRRDAVDRLIELLRAAAHRPRPRKPTKATYGSKKRRLESKKQRAESKEMRRKPGFD